MSESTQLVAAQMAYDNEKKSPTPAWLLWWFTGGFGGHRYYLGDTGYAVAMTFLGPLTLGIWPLIDAFNINRRLREKNALKQQEVFIRYDVTHALPHEVRAELAAMPEAQSQGQLQGQQAALPQGQYQPQAQQNQYQPGQFQQNPQGYVPQQQQYHQNPQAQQYSQDFQQGYAQQSYQAQPQGYGEQQNQQPYVAQASAESAPAKQFQSQQVKPEQTKSLEGEVLPESEQSN